MQLHGKANQLLPAFGKRFGEGVADLGDKDQAGRRVRHAGGKVDAGAHHVHLAPAVFKQAEALDAVGLGDEALDEGDHLVPRQAVDAVEHDRVGQASGCLLYTSDAADE